MELSLRGNARALVSARAWQFLFAAVVGEIEGGYALPIARPLEHLAVPQRARRVVIAGAPVVFHGQSRKFVVLRISFVVLGAIDQVHDAVDLAIGDGTKLL